MVVETFGAFLLHVGAVLGAIFAAALLGKRLLKEHDRRVKASTFSNALKRLD